MKAWPEGPLEWRRTQEREGLPLLRKASFNMRVHCGYACAEVIFDFQICLCERYLCAADGFIQKGLLMNEFRILIFVLTADEGIWKGFLHWFFMIIDVPTISALKICVIRLRHLSICYFLFILLYYLCSILIFYWMLFLWIVRWWGLKVEDFLIRAVCDQLHRLEEDEVVLVLQF